jgi:thiamine transport system permease protein
MAAALCWCCLASLSKAIPRGSHDRRLARSEDRLHSRLTDFILIALALLLLLPPLLAVIVDGLNLNLLSVLQQPVLWQAPGPRCASRWPPGCCASS